MPRMDMSLLNPPQREAVTHGAGPLLVLAGAGSGKTRVITHRIAYLLEGGIPARAIAALTFTNKAAAEMRERVGALIRDRKRARELTMGTFHSLGLQILRRERKALGYPRGFAIYDTSDQIGIVRELLRTISVPGRRFDPKAILTRISLAKNAFVAPDAFEPADGDEYDEITAELYPHYQQALRTYAALDFDDLITETVRLFEDHADVRERWQGRFHHVMVDEYQDTNRAQLLMVKHLVAGHDNLCVVGDDDQSIYSWRGADPTNILRFDRMFPGARVVVLDQNYRSTTTILAAANAVIANNHDRRDKTLWSALGDGEQIAEVVAPDSETEARFVAVEIDTLRQRGNGRLRWRDFAVLYRSNIQAKPLEEALRDVRIPYTMYGGQQFFERKEVKDILAYLRLALNERDEIALRRVINYPARGIGATTVERIAERAQAERAPMWGVLERVGELSEVLRPQAIAAVEGFVALIGGVRAELEAGAGVVPVTRALIERIALYDDLRAAAASITAAQRRIDNIEGLLGTLERHEQKRRGTGALAEYLRRLSLETSDDDRAEPGDAVVLTTLHGAKGLEFPIVFIVGMEEELLPHARTLAPQVTDVSDPDHVSDISEERRLCYVGITRAQRTLYLSRAAVRRFRGRTTPRTPSRFLQEIPGSLLAPRDVEAEARAPVEQSEVRAFFQSFLAD